MDPLIAGQQHVDLTGELHPLRRQSRADGFADQGAVAVRCRPGHVGGNGDIVGLSHFFFFSSNLA